jgi:hypothetical protein
MNGHGTNFAAALLLYGALLGSSTPALAGTAPDGAYERLTPTNQVTARALFEAQVVDPTPGAPRRLTLAEIAARRQSGQGWGEIFTELKSRGLLREQSVGHVLARYNTEQRRRAVAQQTRGAEASPMVSPSAADKER